MKTNRFEDTYSIHEIYSMNGGCFPFWIKGWGHQRSVVKVLYALDRIAVGERYSLDKTTLLQSYITLPLDHQKGWLPG